MPTWVKYGIAVGIGFAIGQNPNILSSVAHGLQQFLGGIGHG